MVDDPLDRRVLVGDLMVVRKGLAQRSIGTHDDGMKTYHEITAEHDVTLEDVSAAGRYAERIDIL